MSIGLSGCDFLKMLDLTPKQIRGLVKLSARILDKMAEGAGR